MTGAVCGRASCISTSSSGEDEYVGVLSRTDIGTGTAGGGPRDSNSRAG